MARKHYYDYGDKVRCTVTFTDADGVVHDPTAVFFSFFSPSDDEATTYEYSQDAQLVRVSTGVYYVDLDCDEAGPWRFRFYATGTGQAAGESYFTVKESAFD